LRGQLESGDLFRQPPAVSSQYGTPDSGNVGVDFNQSYPLGESLERCREANDPASRKRFDKFLYWWGLAAQPPPDIWNKPSFTTRVTKRAALRYRGDVYDLCRLGHGNTQIQTALPFFIHRVAGEFKSVS